MTDTRTESSRPRKKYPSWKDEGGAGAFFDSVEQLNSQGHFLECIEAIRHLPVSARDWRTAYLHARALQNLAIYGPDARPLPAAPSQAAAADHDAGLSSSGVGRSDAGLSDFADKAAVSAAIEAAAAARMNSAAEIAQRALDEYQGESCSGRRSGRRSRTASGSSQSVSAARSSAGCSGAARGSSGRGSTARSSSGRSGCSRSLMPKGLLKIISAADTVRFSSLLSHVPGCSRELQGPPEVSTLLMILSFEVLDEVRESGIHDERFHRRQALAWLYLNEPERASACAKVWHAITQDDAASAVTDWAQSFKDAHGLSASEDNSPAGHAVYWPAGRDRPYDLNRHAGSAFDGAELSPGAKSGAPAHDGRDVLSAIYSRNETRAEADFYSHRFHSSMLISHHDLNISELTEVFAYMWDIAVDSGDIITVEANHLNARSQNIHILRYNNMTAMITSVTGLADITDLIRPGLGASQVAPFTYRDSIIADQAGLESWDKAGINPYGSFADMDRAAQAMASARSAAAAQAMASARSAAAAQSSARSGAQTSTRAAAQSGARSGADQGGDPSAAATTRKSRRALKPWQERAQRLLKRRRPHEQNDPPELTANEVADSMYLHRGHIEITVYAPRQHPFAAAVFFTQIMRAICFSCVIKGFIINGGLFRRDIFLLESAAIFESMLPVDAFVFFGINDDGPVPSVFTRGMRSLGMHEIEVSYPGEDPEVLLAFLRDAVNIILTRDIVLQHGQDVDLKGLLRHKIELSPGINIADYTLKIGYDISKGAAAPAPLSQQPAAGSATRPDARSNRQSATRGALAAPAASPGQNARAAGAAGAQRPKAGGGARQRLTVMIDDSRVYSRKLKGTALEQDRLASMTHMAFFLRWAIRRHLTSPSLEQRYPQVVDQVRFGSEKFDLRQFIYDEFDGRINDDIFNDAGRDFVHHYWQKEHSPDYFEDLRIIAQDSPSGSALPKLDDYDLSFVTLPFDEKTWSCVRAVLNARLSAMHHQYVDEAGPAVQEAAQQLTGFLDCPCTFFPSMADDSTLISAWQSACIEGQQSDFVPVMIPAEPLMLQMLINRSGSRSQQARAAVMGEFDLQRLQAIRQNALSTPLPDGAALLSRQIDNLRTRIEDHGWDWEEDIISRAMRKITVTRFQSIWNFQTRLTRPMILARIPARQPWQVFAWLPWELRRSGISSTDFMAIARYFHERYGAVLSVMSNNELEFTLPAPLKKRDKSLKAALEYYGLCPNIIELNSGKFRPELYDRIGNVATLASTLSRSRVWYFNWDLMWRRFFARRS